MTNKDIINYIMTTPQNTNPAILKQHLEEQDKSLGAGDTVIHVNSFRKNVKEYGAKGDGTTDDTQAIADAIQALEAGETLYFPTGIYRVSNINLKSNMNVQGDGWGSVIQLLDATSNYHGRNNCFNIEGKRSEYIKNIIIRDIKLDGRRATQQSTAPSQDGRLDGLHIRFASDIYVENVWMYNNGYHGCIMTFTSNIIFNNCKATDNGFRPIHGHTQIYNCRINNCICENNGLGLTGGSGYENDSIFFFGAQDLIISNNIIKSNRRGCITIGQEQKTSAEDDIIASGDVTITGNVCECYEDLEYIPTAESDTGVAKFSSMGIVIYGGESVFENLTVTGNTIRNAHEAFKIFASDNIPCSLKAVISGNTIVDCSYGVHAVEVKDMVISNNLFRNLKIGAIHFVTVSDVVLSGNFVNCPDMTVEKMCALYSSNNIVIRDNTFVSGSKTFVYSPASNENVVVIHNILKGFTGTIPIINPNGYIIDNIAIDQKTSGEEGGEGESNIEKIRLSPYTNPGFVRDNLSNPNTTSTTWSYTTPVEMTDKDKVYELNTYRSVDIQENDPSVVPTIDAHYGIVFLNGTDLNNAVGIASLSNSIGEITYSSEGFGGTNAKNWGVTISITADKVKELFPEATHVMMQTLKALSDPDSLSNAYHQLNDGHSYIYREQ